MRRLFKMPPQVLRLFLLALGIVTAYSVARYFLSLLPASSADITNSK